MILNDNCMSIDPAVGALKDYLTSISTSKNYNKPEKNMEIEIVRRNRKIWT